MERRSLLDGDQTPTRETMNVFDDEFEVEDFDLVADGFRPGHNHDREGAERQGQEGEVPITSVSAHYAPAPVTTAGPSRNSTRKSRGQENPFASPDDEAELPLHRTPSGNFAPFTHRSISSSSSHQYARTNSPRFGASGPSHPYGMYPQGTMPRTASIATTSTARPTRYSTTPNGPQHPYALYPQGVDDDDLDDDNAEQNHVPIGFLGLGQSYHRRRGPDGEEQDIIGDYGHTEQLPPYTRYPEDGPEKMPLMGVPNPPSALHSRAPVLGTDPSMPLMHDHLQPTPQRQQSMMDESNLARQPSTTSGTSRLSSQNTLLDKEYDGPKSWKDKSWSERFKTRFCGIIPFWLLVAMMIVIAFVGSLVGGVIGGYVEGATKARLVLPKAEVCVRSNEDAVTSPTPTASRYSMLVSSLLRQLRLHQWAHSQYNSERLNKHSLLVSLSLIRKRLGAAILRTTQLWLLLFEILQVASTNLEPYCFLPGPMLVSYSMVPKRPHSRPTFLPFCWYWITMIQTMEKHFTSRNLTISLSLCPTLSLMCRTRDSNETSTTCRHPGPARRKPQCQARSPGCVIGTTRSWKASYTKKVRRHPHMCPLCPHPLSTQAH